jgi:hypothetical protein
VAVVNRNRYTVFCEAVMSAGRPRLPAGRKLLHLNVQVTPEQKAWLAREPFGLSFATRRAIAIAMNQPDRNNAAKATEHTNSEWYP